MLKRIADLGVNGVLLLLVVVALLPFAFMVVTGIQRADTVSLSFDPDRLQLDNFVRLFTDYGFGRALVTSALVVTLACVVNFVVSSLAAFAFAKKPFPGSETLFWIYIATMMVPVQVTMIPLFVIVRDLGLLNTHIALILPIINAFGVFLIRQFMSNVPDELLEAARIDGASDRRVFVAIVVPLIRPVLVALTVFTFLTTWNDFLWPLVVISDESMQTVTLAAARLQGRFVTEYGLVMAGATVSFLVPFLIYLVLQRQFVQGVASVGLKG
ncbi:carbohydrate ABC transporter permease [Phytoactinopolyspora mesophila]|uniref:ABC transporter permease subunit n=1 Tax=Phytoactinopolyspora mesophila TaxID=2650750 RepID=A0A7K3M7B9_9ACTN|nr:carbohydrate ABC transporter permease [Phytoactinopolyspora mesophila]NDL59211.1 ABC transporter permease subunit [Phytoactinopolyspora mesophila]